MDEDNLLRVTSSQSKFSPLIFILTCLFPMDGIPRSSISISPLGSSDHSSPSSCFDEILQRIEHSIQSSRIFPLISPQSSSSRFKINSDLIDQSSDPTCSRPNISLLLLLRQSLLSLDPRFRSIFEFGYEGEFSFSRPLNIEHSITSSQ
jgi:hypothetical protein